LASETLPPEEVPPMGAESQFTTFSRQLDGQALTFVFDDGRITDEQTGTEWNVLGQAVSGLQTGSQLTPVVSINHFWFSWAAFKPETRIYQP